MRSRLGAPDDPTLRRGMPRAHRSGTRCRHGRGHAICFECFKEGSARTKARQEAWAQRALPFDDEPAAQLTTTQRAHRQRMLEYLQSIARRRA